jgi:arginyl-tRNA synthetase
MTSLANKLADIVGSAFQQISLPNDLGAVRVSDRPDLAQFQCNGAMAAAKLAKKNPREVAQEIVDVLSSNEIFTTIEIAGPGFINLNVTNDFLQSHLQSLQNFGVEKAPENKTIVLDYGGMNVAKAMHVGHLRPNIIGDCLRNVYRFKGYNALGDVHLGDWGLQMGQIISEFEIRYPDWPYFDLDFKGDYPTDAPFEYSELEEIYPKASAACKENEERLELARQATAEFQEGRAGYVALWRHFIDLSITDIKQNLAPLNIDFDIWKGEADAAQFVPEIAKDLKARSVTEDSKGAVIITVDKEDDNKEMPPLLFFKSDGAMTYGTTDIATIYDRVKLYPDLFKIIYVVDRRQSLHFEQVFRSVERAGYVDEIDCVHVGFGTVNGEDGKPFKTREGKAMTFRQMVSTVIDKAQERLSEASLDADIDEKERAEIARMVGVSALKFTELSNQPHMDYTFNIDRMTSFEGKTGPYLLYQTVRIKSLLKKAVAQGYEISHDLKIEEADQELALLLTEFPDIFDLMLRTNAPHHLCDYAYKLAQAFSSFYANCHILSEGNESLRASRLKLCDMTASQIIQILSLLGIQVPERM